MTRMKKSFSTCIWILFAVMIATGYTIYSTNHLMLYKSFEMSAFIAAGILIILGAVLSLSAWIGRKKQKMISPSKKTVQIVEFIAVAVLLGATVFFHMNQDLQLLIEGGSRQGLFQVASVSQSENMLLSTPLLLRSYILLLHSIFMLVGNIYEVGIIVQMILLVIGSLFYYAVLRKATNLWIALSFLAVALFSYSGFTYATDYNTNMLLYAASGIVAWVLYRYYVSTKMILLHFAWSVIASVLSMCLLMMDIIGVFAVIAFIVISIEQCRKEEKKRSEVFFVGAFGVATMMLMICLLDGVFMLMIQEIYLTGINTSIEGIWYLLEQEYFLCILVIPVFTYSWQKNKSKMATVMLMMLVCMFIEAFGIYTAMPFEYILQLLCVILLMMGLQLYVPNFEVAHRKTAEPKKVAEIVEEKKPTEIFIPKQMNIPKRVEKPKLDYEKEATEMVMDFDIEVDVSEGFDIE